MSEPDKNCKDSFYGARSELISAMSSLHMDDEIDIDWSPIYKYLEEETEEERLEENIPFLDEKYTFAKHAKEHLKQANRYLTQLEKERRNFKSNIFNILLNENNSLEEKKREIINLIIYDTIEKDELSNLNQFNKKEK
jgi:hypothetical protein